MLTAILLISNVRAEIGLTIGGFLNVQFILAGQVNPSVFYLVAAIGLLLWRLEKVATPRNARYHTRRSVTLAVLTIIVFGPSIRTVDPAFAMEDPALVIIFLACLTAATIWLSEPSTSLAIADTGNDPTRANDTRGSDTRDDDTDKDGAKPMVLDLQDLSEATIESTLPMMLSLKQMEGISSLPHRQRSTIANSDEEADDEQQPRIRDLAPLPTEPVSGEHDDESSDRREDGLEDEPYVEVVDIV